MLRPIIIEAPTRSTPVMRGFESVRDDLEFVREETTDERGRKMVMTYYRRHKDIEPDGTSKTDKTDDGAASE